MGGNPYFNHPGPEPHKVISMHNTLKLSTAALALALCAGAQASTITIQTGFSGAGPQADAATYKAVVDAAVAAPSPGYGTASPAFYDNISNQSLFGSSNSNIAFKSTVDFGVSTANSGTWQIRSGVDFGGGGAILLTDWPTISNQTTCGGMAVTATQASTLISP